jgi:hypothetical protein
LRLFLSDIFREIDEELRRDNLLKLWARYGRYVVMAAIGVLLVAAGIVGWRNHQLTERRAEATRYAGALGLAQYGKAAEAEKVFGAIAKEGGGYALLASLEQAGLLAKSGNRKAAIAIYDRIAATPGIEPEFHDLAVLLSVMQGMAEADPQRTIARLAPLTTRGNPWRPTALELTALARLKAGDKKAALDLYKRLADDLTAPRSLRARAAEMAAALAS